MRRNTAIILVLVFAVCTAISSEDWKLYEETYLKGTITGVTKIGSVFQTVSGSVYEVTGVTVQVIVAVMPKAVVMQNGSQFKLIVDGFKEPLICRQLAPPTQSASPQAQPPETKAPRQPAIDSTMPLNQLISETQQQEMGLHKLTARERRRLRKFLAELYLRGVEDGKMRTVDEASSPDAKAALSSVIESTIDGEFEGWSGETIVKLMNGQIWQQASYHYEYHYAYMPKVLIYQSGGVYKMKVEGVREPVVVTQLK